MQDGVIHLSALAWLLTYGVHSTVLLGCAWLACRRGWVRSVRGRELLWRTTLVGGLVTAGVQFGVGFEPWAGRYALESAVAATPQPYAAGHDSLASSVPAPTDQALRAPREPSLQPSALAIDWTRWAVLGWAAGGLLLLTLLLNAARRLRTHLAGRRALTEGAMPRLLEELRASAGLRRRVRLSVSPHLQAPIAMGSLFPHIVVPPRAVEDLTPELQAPLLAHELGHIARFDPLWFDFCRLLETLFFFQPLNRLARRRLAACAEFQCDAWAVRRTGDRLSLARCLAEVAGWLVGEPRPLPACGMAELRSPLAERVTRILHAEPERSARRVPTALAGATLLVLTAAGAPGFAGVAREPAPRPALDAPAAPPAPITLARQLFDALDSLEAELQSLDEDLRFVRQEAERRAVPEEVHATLAVIEARARDMRARQARLRELLDLWSTRTSPLDEPEPRESR
jgi:beta-lactamase regulating signal transducer with metallopeptidase domain